MQWSCGIIFKLSTFVEIFHSRIHASFLNISSSLGKRQDIFKLTHFHIFKLRQHIEALIFASEQSISAEEIAGCLNIAFNLELTPEQVTGEILVLKEKYQQESSFFELVEIDGGFQFLTKNQFSGTLNVLLQQRNKKKLSNAAMETLAIIAYRQPLTKTGVEQIRGVNCDYSVQRLLEKELITIIGKSDAPGRPILYGTSKRFMDYFKLNSLEDLPQLKDIQQAENEIGVMQ